MVLELEGFSASGALEFSRLWTLCVIGCVTLQFGEVWELLATLGARLWGKQNGKTFLYDAHKSLLFSYVYYNSSNCLL